MARVLSWGGERKRRTNEGKRNQEGRAKTARPTSRLLCPRPPLGSFTKEMGRPVVDESCASRRAANQEKPSGRGKRPKGFQPISSEPTPSHRPWASAPGATPKRTNDGRGCLPCPEPEQQRRPPFRIRRPQSPSSYPTRSPTKRILVSLGCWSPPLWIRLRRGASGCPRLRRDLSQIVFRLQQGGKAPCVRLHFYVTQRDHFRLLY